MKTETKTQIKEPLEIGREDQKIKECEKAINKALPVANELIEEVKTTFGITLETNDFKKLFTYGLGFTDTQDKLVNKPEDVLKEAIVRGKGKTKALDMPLDEDKLKDLVKLPDLSKFYEIFERLQPLLVVNLNNRRTEIAYFFVIENGKVERDQDAWEKFVVENSYYIYSEEYKNKYYAAKKVVEDINKYLQEMGFESTGPFRGYALELPGIKRGKRWEEIDVKYFAGK